MVRRILPFVLSGLAPAVALGQAQGQGAAQAQAQAPAPASRPAVSVATPVARAVVDQLASALERDFVYPETGARYGAMLRGNLAGGAYDALAGKDLADRLTDDLQAVQPDGHLRVRFTADEAPAATPHSASVPRPAPIEQARWISPDIAFVRYNLFTGDDDEVAATRAFMDTHAGAKVLIFDLRTHRGGGLDEMDAILPWLFDKPTGLVRMATRKSVAASGNSPLQGVPTLHEVAGDPAFVTQEHRVEPGANPALRKARVYLLTSPRTASAGEHFTQAMKSTRRATIVGEATAGANHFGYGLDLPNGFSTFVPVGRTFDPATGKDWEGAGIAPDIAVPAREALATVLVREGVPRAQAQAVSDALMPAAPMTRR
ncbi:S41 family peptidase [Novosphingobium huizhouense]|uniref:S41 family peptidase n=1 Tax=Novosphingobium huizhouense TaxID=2866625 RepID=UPI001CD915A4|nr:S41 family peptidase [Novosphingobium huizhouense]